MRPRPGAVSGSPWPRPTWLAACAPPSACAARDGVLVREVAEDSPAAAAGLLRGDLVVAAAGQPVGSIDDLLAAVDGVGEDGTLSLRVVRGTEEVDLTVRFEAGRATGPVSSGPRTRRRAGRAAAVSSRSMTETGMRTKDSPRRTRTSATSSASAASSPASVVPWRPGSARPGRSGERQHRGGGQQ